MKARSRVSGLQNKALILVAGVASALGCGRGAGYENRRSDGESTRAIAAQSAAALVADEPMSEIGADTTGSMHAIETANVAENVDNDREVLNNQVVVEAEPGINGVDQINSTAPEADVSELAYGALADEASSEGASLEVGGTNSFAGASSASPYSDMCAGFEFPVGGYLNAPIDSAEYRQYHTCGWEHDAIQTCNAQRASMFDSEISMYNAVDEMIAAQEAEMVSDGPSERGGVSVRVLFPKELRDRTFGWDLDSWEVVIPGSECKMKNGAATPADVTKKWSAYVELHINADGKGMLSIREGTVPKPGGKQGRALASMAVSWPSGLPETMVIGKTVFSSAYSWELSPQLSSAQALPSAADTAGLTAKQKEVLVLRMKSEIRAIRIKFINEGKGRFKIVE